MRKGLFLQIQQISSNNIKYILLTAIYLSPLILIHVFVGVIFNVNDESMVIGLIRVGEPGVLILNYLTSTILVFLYSIIPTISWYSLALVSFIVIAILFWVDIVEQSSNGMDEKKSYRHKIPVHLLGVAIFFLLYLRLTVTSVTILLLITGTLWAIVRKKSIYIAPTLALLLRDTIVPFLIPYFLILSLLMINRKNLVKTFWRKSLFLPIIILLLSNFFKPQDYKDYLKWNNARTYFHDFKIDVSKNFPNDPQYKQYAHLLKGWWVFDESLLPSSVIINQSGNILDVLKNKISPGALIESVKKIIATKTYGMLLLISFILSICYSYDTKDRKRIINNIIILALSVVYIILLMMLRDVGRVTFFTILAVPMFLTILIIRNFKYSLFKIAILSIVIFILGINVFGNIISNKRFIRKQDHAIDEYNSFTKKLNGYFMPSYHYPFAGTCNVIKKTRLFYEDNLPTLFGNSHAMLPASWLSRHPYFNKMINSVLGEKFDYCEVNISKFITLPNVFFVGNPELSKSNILKFYSSLTNCDYEIKVVRSGQYIAICRIIKLCHDQMMNDMLTNLFDENNLEVIN